MKPFIDIASSVSDELSQILEAAVNDPDADEAPTLGSVRRIVYRAANGEQLKADRLHFDQNRSLLEEIDDLIEQFGDEAPAIDFITVKASESLTRTISALMDTGASTPPTLGMVRDAMLHGLVARLVGDGIIDPDEDETLQEEIETLISRYGQDTVAENFLHYE
ncbi:MAG: hypothetical protein AUK53_03825 [Betaproteobacteria bacterium CG2_30_59_46]|nr:MAG: hypothetical protein AUK53_03825 [Betaproteobacteria bacterium CG2_30_59_46]PIQ11823.1 MAG: hypothetical protein COW70_11610 [Hydrogenophilales bacterium CG18_big_fil_WC_8_21_14_2_50_58_12]PIX99883.1 MAG: hypothetical protein COZ23_09770 [Hydrogenophilales bacterium CG_4_10_14_3_um_filter_58_23]PJB06983.1 MAG: hypothetical protein CO125_05990 [Hydrogenophilales bacterium CG_4_9_14_3_um_filter_59_35]